ncbi:uncharacterized protein LOC106161004 [Lingula anatina]|uniref:Uncharacterized protein LOC106161004 n=1 Tax=Lingula anatina TaxID=7574 RepID=A0A1S3I4Y4_LINAN|nr:uncharacterized protein LOC106161004 [Lingula anatina]|eukprot:XP_013393283.1 uncharacterized protein LOC106161004 [Lingula anatina]
MAQVLQLVVGIIVFEIICCFCPLHVTGVKVSSCRTTVLPGLRNDGNLNTTRDILMQEPQEGLQDCARMKFKSTEAKSVQFCTTSKMCIVFSTELTPAIIEDAMADSNCVLMKFTCDEIKPNIDLTEVGTTVSLTDRVTSDQPGDSESNPGANCTDILQAQPEAVSGVYWISTQDQTFKVFCDMDTDGGGWTLVWSYTFTNFSSNLTGALTPRPSWSASQGDVPISITPPLNETDFNAVDFSLWKFIGAQQFLVKSTINHWITCNGNKLVEFKLGSIDCRVVKTIGNSSCNDVVPIRFYTTNGFSSDYPLARKGPALAVSSSPYSIDTTAYYYFWASTSGSYCPVHDPCGLGRCYGHKPDPVMPYGNIYIR